MFSEADFFEMLSDGGTHRKQFSEHSGIQKSKASPTFSVPFDSGLCQHFCAGTGFRLKWNPKFEQYYCFLRTPEDIAKAEQWEASQGSLVFIRNLLHSTTALDTNFVDNSSGRRTLCGKLENRAKHKADDASIDQLASLMQEAIGSISYLASATGVFAVPPSPQKRFDLPTVLAAKVAKATKKLDLTSQHSFEGRKKSVKNLPVDEKWKGWSDSGLKIPEKSVQGRSIILIDDKYQSGATMHYVASRLFDAGATKVHGLVAVKTLRDSDNDDVVDT